MLGFESPKIPEYFLGLAARHFMDPDITSCIVRRGGRIPEHRSAGVMYPEMMAVYPGRCVPVVQRIKAFEELFENSDTNDPFMDLCMDL